MNKFLITKLPLFNYQIKDFIHFLLVDAVSINYCFIIFIFTFMCGLLHVPMICGFIQNQSGQMPDYTRLSDHKAIRVLDETVTQLCMHNFSHIVLRKSRTL